MNVLAESGPEQQIRFAETARLLLQGPVEPTYAKKSGRPRCHRGLVYHVSGAR
jgi:hypothetical protein